jgi:hypothetical protein
MSEKFCNDVHETMSGTCYKYRETPDIFITMNGNNSTCSDNDMEISKFVKHDETKNIITYNNKNRSSSVDLSIVKDEKDVKDQNFEVSNTFTIIIRSISVDYGLKENVRNTNIV